MEQPATSAPVIPDPRRRSGVDPRPVDAAQGGARRHPLEERLLRAGYNSQQEFADASGVSRPTINNTIRGLQNPRPATVKDLARALSTPTQTLDWLTLDAELKSPENGVTTTAPQPLVVQPDAAGEGQEVVR